MWAWKQELIPRPADLSGLALAVTGSGTAVTFSATQHLGGLSIAAGNTVQMTTGGNKVLVTPNLTVDGTLDLADEDLVIDYSAVSPVGTWTGSAYDGVSGLIASGRIVSSSASGTFTGLGVRSGGRGPGNQRMQTTLFSGQTVDSSSVLVKFTYGGDANLDGKINVDDYGHIDSSIPLGTRGWFNGDFNYDGKINVDDYGIIDFNIGIQNGIL
jgi:hypothetical protein